MDSKASIKIEFSVYGSKTYEGEWWINYSPDYDGVDSRIKEWFSKCYEEAYEQYRIGCDNYEEKRLEKIERKEYERLKEKFEKQP